MIINKMIKLRRALQNNCLNGTIVGINRIINDAHYESIEQTPVICRMLFRRINKLSKQDEMIYNRALGISLHWCIHGDYSRKIGNADKRDNSRRIVGCT